MKSSRNQRLTRPSLIYSILIIMSVPQAVRATDFISRCWGGSHECGGQTDAGAYLNVFLQQGFGPIEFPPLKLDPYLSSLPLVGTEAAYSRGPSPFRERPTYHDTIDLIGGLPLLQNIDFELPFGSAVFRHVRTYSQNIADQAECTQGQPAAGTFWDWNGTYWMMSENPIFYIDVGSGLHGWVKDNDPRRCYFIPDAHHAIPFILDVAQQKYLAPPWFDATLDHNGTLDAQGEWINRPTEFYIWLNRKSVKYTIQAHYEDVEYQLLCPNGQFYENLACCEGNECDDCELIWDAHLPASNDPPFGEGVPYYGLVTSIEDRYGNRVEYEYCDFYQTECGETQYCSDGSEVHYCQNCSEKGQLKTIKLRTAEGQIAWTLAYCHRAFRNDVWPDVANEQHFLHSIHVYEGDVTIPESCLTIGWELFQDSTPTWEEIEQIECPNLPLNWKYEVKYLQGSYFDSSEQLINNDVFPQVYNLYNPALIKASIAHKYERDGQEVIDHRYHLYRYDPMDVNCYSCAFDIKSYYSPSNIDQIMKSLPNNGEEEEIRVDGLLGIGDDEEINIADPGTGQLIAKQMKELAEVGFVGVAWAAPSPEFDQELRDWIGGNSGSYEGWLNTPIWQMVDRRGEYEHTTANFYTYRVYPDSVDPSDRWLTNIENMHYPYRNVGHDDNDLSTLPLHERFFVMIIDEHDGSCNWGNVCDYLKTRRVVEMNSAGFVLRDRTWTFDDSGPTLESQLGFAEDYRTDCKGRVLQKRTRGWSVAEDPNSPEDPTTEGLIYVYEYEDDACNWNVAEDHCECPDIQEVTGEPGDLIAEGFKRGTAGTTYWTKYLERHPDRPELVTKQVEFADPVTNYTSPGNELLTEFVLGEDQCVPGIGCWEGPILAKTTIQPPVSFTLGGPALYGVTKEQNDDNGNPEWSGVGSLSDPHDIGTAVQFFVTHTQSDSEGRPTLITFDTDEGGMPSGFQRVANTPALNLSTTFEYDNFGLNHMVYPSDRELRVAWVGDTENGTVKQWIFNDLVWLGNGNFKTLSPVEIKEYEFYDPISISFAGFGMTGSASSGGGSKLVSSKKIKLLATDNNPDGEGAEANPAN